MAMSSLLLVVRYIRRVSTAGGSDKSDGIPMDSLITIAARTSLQAPHSGPRRSGIDSDCADFACREIPD
ncbi:hypothetical protein DYH55_02660 [Methylovirgula sp. 4M-Z18]|nr:hypothetical protein DYH55_02660 [Methylovirgula sp. 4M-Z18]